MKATPQRFQAEVLGAYRAICRVHGASIEVHEPAQIAPDEVSVNASLLLATVTATRVPTLRLKNALKAVESSWPIGITVEAGHGANLMNLYLLA